MKKIKILAAAGLFYMGFTIMTIIAISRTNALNEMQSRYEEAAELADALQVDKRDLQAQLDKVTAENETLRLEVMDYENLTAEITAKPEEANAKLEETDPLIPLELPPLPTNVKCFTDYRAYNIPSEPQYRLQAIARTDKNGLRRYGDDYIVGMGSFYFTEIGGRFEVTLDTGNTFTIILGDMKADCDTDETNMYAPCTNYAGEQAANVLEFIIDKEVLPEQVYKYGSVDRFDFLRGNIVKIAYIGKADFE